MISVSQRDRQPDATSLDLELSILTLKIPDNALFSYGPVLLTEMLSGF
jgi:hypothetical protein